LFYKFTMEKFPGKISYKINFLYSPGQTEQACSGDGEVCVCVCV